MEPVIVWRAVDELDEYGNPVGGEPQPWAEFQALVAPNHGGESNEVARLAVITGYTIYIEGQGETGAQETDLVQLPSRHGERLFPIEGLVAVWRKRSGEYKGDQFAVKVVDG